MIERHQDVEIRGHRFRIHRVLAADGSWIVSQFAARRTGDREIYDRITRYLFNRIDLLQQVGNGSESPLRIYRDGQYLIKELDLEYDLEFLEELYKAAFDFNLSPFLKKLIEESKKEEAKRELEQTQDRR